MVQGVMALGALRTAKQFCSEQTLLLIKTLIPFYATSLMNSKNAHSHQ